MSEADAARRVLAAMNEGIEALATEVVEQIATAVVQVSEYMEPGERRLFVQRVVDRVTATAYGSCSECSAPMKPFDYDQGGQVDVILVCSANQQFHPVIV
jgi:hypothetical protein